MQAAVRAAMRAAARAAMRAAGRRRELPSAHRRLLLAESEERLHLPALDRLRSEGYQHARGSNPGRAVWLPCWRHGFPANQSICKSLRLPGSTLQLARAAEPERGLRRHVVQRTSAKREVLALTAIPRSLMQHSSVAGRTTQTFRKRGVFRTTCGCLTCGTHNDPKQRASAPLEVMEATNGPSPAVTATIPIAAPDWKGGSHTLLVLGEGVGSRARREWTRGVEV